MTILHLATVDVDLDTGAIGDAPRLSTTELALLTWLAAHPGVEVSRERLLREVWRYPGSTPQTRVVDLTMARLRKKVEADPRHPAHLITVQGVGYRFVPAAPPPPRPLPRPANAFIGRAAERARIDVLLDRGARLVTLVGPGGVGKTRLAVEAVAHRPGVVFCDASEARDLSALRATVHRALPSPEPSARAATLEVLLAGLGSVLLVLDNVEQVVQAAAEAVPDFLRQAPGLAVLVTSREPLGLADEHLVDVAPLLGARVDEAVALLVARGWQHDVEVDADDADVRDLAVRMDGLPLGLELAAALLRVRQPAEIASDPEVARRGGPARHASLRAAVAWSWDLLGDGERAALASLAELRGAWPATAAEIFGVSPVQLDHLVRQSLVQRYPDTGRFGLLDTVGRYARARQRDPLAAAERHVQWCAHDEGAPSLADLEAALRHVVRHGHADMERVFLRLRERLFAVASLERVEEVAGALLDHATDAETAVCLHLDLAMAKDLRGDLGGAVGVLEAAAADAGSPKARSSVMGNLAGLHLRMGALVEARAMAIRAVASARAQGDPRSLAMRLQFLAGLEMVCGRLGEADALLREALGCAEPWPLTVGALLQLQARVRHHLGADVGALLDDADRLLVGAPRLATTGRALRVGVAQDLGAWDRARALLAELEGPLAAHRDDVLLASSGVILHARDRVSRGDPRGGAALLRPLLARAGADRWLAGRVVPHLVRCVPLPEALAAAGPALARARGDGLVLEVALIVAGLCAHPDAPPDALAAWRAEGAAACDEMGVAADAWLRAAFEE